MPRDEKVGAAPEVLMAIVESDVHHLRQQADLDRRSTAARLVEDRERLIGIETAQGVAAIQIARAADSIVALGEGARAMQATQSLILQEMHRAQGAVRFLRWAFGAGIFLEAARLYMEHAK